MYILSKYWKLNKCFGGLEFKLQDKETKQQNYCVNNQSSNYRTPKVKKNVYYFKPVTVLKQVFNREEN